MLDKENNVKKEYLFVTEDTEKQIKSIVAELNSLLDKDGFAIEEKVTKLLKGYKALEYDVLSPDIAQKTTKEDVKNELSRFDEMLFKIKPEELSKIEPYFAQLLSVCYNRLQTLKILSQNNLNEMGEIRSKLLEGNFKEEQEIDELIKKFFERRDYGKDLIKRIKDLFGILNHIFEVGEHMFALL